MINNYYEFLKAARALQMVKRRTPKSDGSFENDAEHSWAVAMLIITLHRELEKEFNIKLDLEKMLVMAVIHDLGEIEAGDTVTWEPETRIGKEDKERSAVQKLFSILPNETSDYLLQIWEEIEARETLEAKIVKSLDRLDPVIHRLVHRVGWEKVDPEVATIKHLDDRQLPRHEFSKTITELYELVKTDAINKGHII